MAVYTLALKTVSEVAVAFSLFGFVLVVIEKHIDLRTDFETKFGLQEGDIKKPQDPVAD